VLLQRWRHTVKIADNGRTGVCAVIVGDPRLSPDDDSFDVTVAWVGFGTMTFVKG
jgi:hypothetical protein